MANYTDYLDRKAEPTTDLWLHIAKGSNMTMQQVQAIELHRENGGRGYQTKWLDKDHGGHGRIEYLPRKTIGAQNA